MAKFLILTSHYLMLFMLVVLFYFSVQLKVFIKSYCVQKLLLVSQPLHLFFRLAKICSQNTVRVTLQ